VNLLEKQLNNAYFKDVRFPWFTLYKTHKYSLAERTIVEC